MKRNQTGDLTVINSKILVSTAVGMAIGTLLASALMKVDFIKDLVD